MSDQPDIVLVALPIGNAQDTSLRAIEALNAADLIFCEDTRKLSELARLLPQLNITAELKSLPGDVEWTLDFDHFKEFRRWVLVSDAGTPVVNDPGRGLIEFAKKKNWSWRALPGPCAWVMAVHWSGGFGLPFGFGGFAPKAKSSEARELAQFFSIAQGLKSFVFFDTKHQVLTTLEYLMNDKFWSQAKLAMTREMTKTHEELMFGSALTIRSTLEQRLNKNEGLGELTFVLEGPAAAAAATTAVRLEDLSQIRHATPTEAAKIAAKLSGVDRKLAYEAMVVK